MTQQPFSRPGAIDLSGLKQPASAAPGGGAGPAASGAYAVDVSEQNFQDVLESSMSAPVVLVFYSPTRSPESAGLAADLQTLADEFEGKFLRRPGRHRRRAVDRAGDADPVRAARGAGGRRGARPPLFQDAPPIDELRTALNQVFQQLATQGFTGRHQPRAGAGPVDENGEPEVDPRYAPAQDALEAGDIDLAVAEYQKLVDANKADAEAAGGLAMAKVLQRTQGADLNAARAAAAERPDDVDAQTLVADLDLLGGHVDDAFRRLVELVRRTSEAERDQARSHLIGLFAAVGNDDPRVLRPAAPRLRIVLTRRATLGRCRACSPSCLRSRC